jgi:hypothetical protein
MTTSACSGNATVWSDCFTVLAPKAEDGTGWAELVAQNGRVARIAHCWGGGMKL